MIPPEKNPDNKEYTKQNPERHYWWYQPNVGFMADPPDLEDPESVEAIPMLPIHSGPFITEVRMVLKPEPAMRKRGKRWRPVPDKRWLSIKFQVEYYLPGVTGPVRVQKFPFKMDCISIDRDGEDLLRLGYEGTSRDWDHTYPTKRSHPAATGLGAFRIQGGRNARILSFTEDTPNRNRRAIDGGLLYIGTNPNKLGMKLSTANPPKQFDKEETVSLSIAFRGGMSIHSTGFERPIRNPAPAQMIPLGVKEEDVLEARIDVDMLETIPRSISWQILDPRLSAWKDQWAVEIEDDNTAGTLGHVNETSEWTEPEEDSPEKSKFRSIPRGNRSDKIVGYKIQRGEEMESNSRVSTKGFWSLIHTGVQNEVPWRTLALNMEPIGNVSGPPDWLLMDLMGTTQPIQHDQRKINSTLPDEFSTVSYMHSTTGAINLNNKTYPANNPYFQAPIRTKPLEAVFKHLRSDTEIKALLGGIESYQNSNVFGYVGDLARVNGYAIGESEWERETLLRNMISCLTTRSNTFGVWGVGQVVKKMRNNENWGEFEDGDSVRGEKRFFAIVERYVWPGKDGVPGNAHVDENGELDRLGIHVSEPNIPLNDKSVRDLLFQLPGSPPFKRGGRGRLHLDEKGTHPEFDGPQEVEMNHYAQAALGEVVWKHSPLEDAYNPPQAVTKYRVVYFKYLDE